MQEITAGDYLANIVDCGMKQSKAGNDMVFVTFELKDLGNRLTWNGSLKTEPGKSGRSACDITLQQLVRLGFLNDWDAFATAGNLAQCFKDPMKEWSLNIEMELYNGKMYPKIKWINDPLKSKGVERIDAAVAKAIATSKNLKALTINAMQSEPKEPTKTPTKTPENGSGSRTPSAPLDPW